MNTVVLRIVLLIIGYGCGLLQTGVIISKITGTDIRKHGSGNSGTTNALRVLGFKAGLIVFLGDFCKSLIPCLIVRFILRDSYPDTYILYVLYIGMGAVFGHIFPFYLKFKGGKGIATIGGLYVSLLQPIMIVVLLAAFIATIAISGYMSVGSICLMIECVIAYVIFGVIGKFCFDMSVPASKAAFIEGAVLLTILAAVAIYKHKANIIRLKNHEESKFHFKKQEGV